MPLKNGNGYDEQGISNEIISCQGECMKLKDKRRYTRKPLKIEARYQDNNRNVLKGTVRNISIGGVFIETPHPLARGESICMTRDAVDVGRVIDVDGKVVRCEPEKGMGVEFIDQDNREVKKLISTMRKLDQASMLALSRSAFDTDY
jgi:Tfp pilus assembly protein PilZ